MKCGESRSGRGFTLTELIVVIAIVAVVTAISFPVLMRMKEKATMVSHVAGLRELTTSTLRWVSENNQVLPSPQYPGGHPPDSPAIPKEWDFAGTGSGLWLDGVIYYAVCHQRGEELSGESVELGGSENGEHLKGTVFASHQSYRKNPAEEDWHRHSYAMNRSIQYSSIFMLSDKPELTNKSLSRIAFRPKALLYTENEASNVIGFEDREAIVSTAHRRWSSGKAISSFLDGSVRTLSSLEIPSQSRRTDLASCQFWSGVSLDNFICGTCQSSGGSAKASDSGSEEGDDDSGSVDGDEPEDGGGGGL